MFRFKSYLKEADSRSKMDKLRDLYARPGTPGEKAAAAAAMERMKSGSTNSNSSHSYEYIMTQHNFIKHQNTPQSGKFYGTNMETPTSVWSKEVPHKGSKNGSRSFIRAELYGNHGDENRKFEMEARHITPGKIQGGVSMDRAVPVHFGKGSSINDLHSHIKQAHEARE